jgi:hypothetical protein
MNKFLILNPDLREFVGDERLVEIEKVILRHRMLLKSCVAGSVILDVSPGFRFIL